MMQTLSSRILLACGFAGVMLLTALPQGAAQEGSPFGGAGDSFFNEGKGQKHLRFEATIASSDPFSEMNQQPLPPKGKFRRGEVVQVTVKGTPLDGYHTYPLTRRAPEQGVEQLCKLGVNGSTYLMALEPIAESEAKWVKPKSLPWQLEHDKSFTWTFEVFIKPETPANSTQDLTLSIKAQTCKGRCNWADYGVHVAIPIGAEDPLPAPMDLASRSKTISPTIEPIPDRLKETPAAKPNESSATTPVSSPKSVPKGLLQAILIAIVGGLVSLLTPCVFPMIPITVSYFLKQAEAKHGSALLMALVYSATIVFVLTLGGMLLMRVLVQISSHWITNFALGGIFLFFAMSLLGWYDISLPSWLQDATASRESKGGLFGVFFMALTFSIMSFACVGPIYGGFISVAATSSTAADVIRQFLSVFAFSVAFASPFFLLALFPSLLHGMPRAGSWMNSVKVVMGFLELAAVVKFVRAAEISLTKSSTFLTFDLALGLYIAFAVACGLYLLGLYRLPHDHDTPESIGVPRLMFSLAFITFGLYLTPGLFKNDDGDSQRPRGLIFAWTESFLLPDTDAPKTTNKGRSSSAVPLVWHHKLKEALAQAQRENKLVFIDITGITCTNCKLNEKNAFPDPAIQAAFGKLVLLKLYGTPGVPVGIDQEPDAEGTMKLAYDVFQKGDLPLYVLVRPKGDSYEVVRFDEQGLIRDIPAFVKFLTP